MRDSPLSSSLLLHHLLVQFAVHKCSQKLHQVLPPLILNKKHQFPQFAWPAAQPGCEFGLGLGHWPCGGSSGLVECPVPWHPSVSAHRWILAPVHVSLPLQPPPWYLSILLVHHYANIEISLCMIMETVTLETFSDHVPSLLTAQPSGLFFSEVKSVPQCMKTSQCSIWYLDFFFLKALFECIKNTKCCAVKECKMQPS